MADYTITSPRLQVLRGSIDAPEVLEVQTLNPDLILWDMTRAKHKWPEVRDAPFLWLTFLAWAGCRREGTIPPEVTWEEWRGSVLNVSNLGGDDDDDTGAVDPTLPGPGPG